MIERSRVGLPAGALPGSVDQLSLHPVRVGKSSTSLLAGVKAGRVHLCWVAGVHDPTWQVTPVAVRWEYPLTAIYVPLPFKNFFPRSSA